MNGIKSLNLNMNLETRKYQLIERLMHINEAQLERIEAFIEQESKLQESLDRSLNQVKEGKIIPHVEVEKKYTKWL